jgi:hypothetical protein
MALSDHQLVTRDLRTEVSNGYTFGDAIAMIEQGYSAEHTARRTGFPLNVLRYHEQKPALPAARRRQPQQVPVTVPVTVKASVLIDAVPRAVRGEVSAEAMTYSFSKHAVLRMLARKIELIEVLRVIDAKNKTVVKDRPRPGHEHQNRLRYIHRGLSIVVDPEEREIVTIAWLKEAS